MSEADRQYYFELLKALEDLPISTAARVQLVDNCMRYYLEKQAGQPKTNVDEWREDVHE